jgi:hypothetical protein
MLSLFLNKHYSKLRVSGGTAPWILKLGSGWKRVASFTLRPPYTCDPTYPLNSWLDVFQGLHGCGGEKKRT